MTVKEKFIQERRIVIDGVEHYHDKDHNAWVPVGYKIQPQIVYIPYYYREPYYQQEPFYSDGRTTGTGFNTEQFKPQTTS